MELKTLRKQFEDFQDNTSSARRDAERDRDYVDHKQWTDAEVAILKSRDQEPVVNNRLKKKHNFLVGIEIRSRTDPKAYPRTPQHEQDAEAITDALRFVSDNARMDRLFSESVDEFFCEGSEACIVEMEGGEVMPRRIAWDRFYYDPHSREPDFSDAKFMGVTTWLDRDDVIAMFPEKKKELMELSTTESIDISFEDRPKWYDRVGNSRHRMRVNEHYVEVKGVWKLAFFVGDLFLTKLKDSPYLDDKQKPMCPIEAESCYVDRQNNRYGVLRGDIWLQDEINHRRSKSLHMLSNVTVLAEKGMVESTTRALNQLTSGKAWIELMHDGKLEIDRNQDLSQGQLALYQDAKQEIDDSVVQSAGTETAESGRSKLVDRENDVDELGQILDRHKDFKNRVYRQIWCRIKQFWTDERWIRVTDDEQNIKFSGLNKPVTGRDMLAEQFGIESGQVDAALSQQGISLIPGQLERVVRTDNEVSQMDLDIILAESPDIVSIQQEQFETLATLAQSYGPEHVPFEEVLKLSSLRNKDEFLERTKGDQEQQNAAIQQAQAVQQQDAELSMAERASKIDLNQASADQKRVQAEQQAIETQLAIQGLESIG